MTFTILKGKVTRSLKEVFLNWSDHMSYFIYIHVHRKTIDNQCINLLLVQIN
jgi:hypothetical protein